MKKYSLLNVVIIRFSRQEVLMESLDGDDDLGGWNNDWFIPKEK